jgi:ribonuclease VapC
LTTPASASRQAELLVETSALVAILFEEPEWETFAERILDSKSLTTSVNVFEAVLALTRLVAKPPIDAHARLLKLMQRLAIEIVPFTPEMVPHAVAARERYGRGRKGLNMGDCLSYAAAKQLGLKLLYKGDDFAATDVNG